MDTSNLFTGTLFPHVGGGGGGLCCLPVYLYCEGIIFWFTFVFPTKKLFTFYYCWQMDKICEFYLYAANLNLS